MASRAVSSSSAPESGANLPVVYSRVRPVAEGRLPVTEVTFDRSGAAAPFGDDRPLPLPMSELTYVHPDPSAFPVAL